MWLRWLAKIILILAVGTCLLSACMSLQMSSGSGGAGGGGGGGGSSSSSNSNTSATGGYLVSGMIQPEQDQDLRRFVHGVLVGITGLPPDLVRPKWQLNPAPIPDVETNWLAFGIDRQQQDPNPYMEQTADDGTLMRRHETFDVGCIVYGPNCQRVAGALRDGLYVTQNLEVLFLAGMGLVGVSEIVHLPEIVNDRYYDRADITITIRREIRRDYPILTLLGAQGVVGFQRDGTIITKDWQTPQTAGMR